MSVRRILSRALPALAAVATLAAPALASANVLYSQPYLETDDFGGAFATVLGGVYEFDNFSLASSGTIASISWSGFDLNELLPGTVINPTAFLVNIYADGAGGLPGKLLSTTTIGNSGNAVATDFKFLDQVTLYNYSGNLATPFQAEAGKKYWIAINDPTLNDDWFWATGSGGDSSHLMTYPGQGTTSQPYDLAFALDSSVAAVPEPASVALFALGGLALLGLQAKRRPR